MKKAVMVTKYSQLLRAVRQAITRGRQRAEKAVEREKVSTAWEVGKLIEEHILANKPRAAYDKQVIERLARDLGKSTREVYYMLEFARTYPILQPAAELKWTHYKVLLAVNDEKERNALARRAEKGKWNRIRLRKEVRKYSKKAGSHKDVPAMTVPSAQPGTIGTYRVRKAKKGEYKGTCVVDLGFSNHRSLREVRKKKGRFTHNTIVAIKRGTLSNTKKRGEDDLFTFYAYVSDVVDGDTIKAVINLGFGFETIQTLRLKDINAPEINCAAGRRAKKALSRKLGRKKIVIRTKKSDKYDRYLVDIFVGKVYINAWLVKEGFADCLVTNG